MDWTIWAFLTVLIIAFGVVMIAAGIFSAYFGKGKNRGYGVLIGVIGAAVLIIWLWLTNWSNVTPFCNVNVWNVVYDAIISLTAIVVGALIAVGIFLVAVLKS